MEKFISYRLPNSGVSNVIQMFSGKVINMEEIQKLKKTIELEDEGIKTDLYTNKVYNIFHHSVFTKLKNGAFDFGKRYFVEVV